MPRRPLPDGTEREEQQTLRVTTLLATGMLLILAVVVALYFLL